LTRVRRDIIETGGEVDLASSLNFAAHLSLAAILVFSNGSHLARSLASLGLGLRMNRWALRHSIEPSCCNYVRDALNNEYIEHVIFMELSCIGLEASRHSNCHCHRCEATSQHNNSVRNSAAFESRLRPQCRRSLHCRMWDNRGRRIFMSMT
jgi:hypothetical protein